MSVQQAESLASASLPSAATTYIATTTNASTSSATTTIIPTPNEPPSGGDFGGHVFSSKKTFGKLTYCHQLVFQSTKI